MSTIAFKNDVDVTRQHISAEEYINIISDSLSMIIFYYNVKENKLCYNASQLQHTLGYDESRYTETFDVFDVIHQNDLVQLKDALQKVQNAEHVEPFACRLLNKDGIYKEYQFECKMHNIAGSIKVILLGFGTEKVAMPETIAPVAKDDTIKDLKQINRELEDFAYAASHDLQEPLRKIITFSTRLAEKCKGKIEEDSNMYLERIMSSASNMRQFIDNLLDFSKISRSKESFTDTNLNFVCQQIKSDLDLAIEETKTTLTVDKLPTIKASPTQIKQLFTNIINNAIKFRREDVNPEIRVSCEVLGQEDILRLDLDTNKEYYRIDIKDNGIGFDKEYSDKIFTIFQRLHGKSEYPGSGIGLAICKKIVEQHSGKLFANSIKGEGTIFSIVLPDKVDIE